MEQPIVVLITAADRVQAGTLAELLVESRLAACVQIMTGVMSLYRYEGKIERAEEAILVVKTTDGQFPQLEAAVRAAHSYETPEIIGLPITQGSGQYIEWLVGNVGNAEG